MNDKTRKELLQSSNIFIDGVSIAYEIGGVVKSKRRRL